MLNNRYPTQIAHRRILISVHGRQVMARVAGSGPAVLALHESPRSSHSLLPLIDALAYRYTVITLDTPGYGESDALEPSRPEASDFVAVIGGVLDAWESRKPSIEQVIEEWLLRQLRATGTLGIRRYTLSSTDCV